LPVKLYPHPGQRRITNRPRAFRRFRALAVRGTSRPAGVTTWRG